MPYQFDFDKTNRILRCRLEGRITDDLLKTFYRDSVDYVARTSPKAAISDFSAIDGFEVTPETVRALARSSPVISDPELPRFIIAVSPKMFGMARMFELEGQTTRPNLHVVQSLEAVCVILGVQNPQFDPL